MGRGAQHVRVGFGSNPVIAATSALRDRSFPRKGCGARHQMAKATANASGTTTRPR